MIHAGVGSTSCNALPCHTSCSPLTVKMAAMIDWSTCTAITSTEQAGFEVFATTDQNLKYQHNLAQRKIAIVVVLTTSWP